MKSSLPVMAEKDDKNSDDSTQSINRAQHDNAQLFQSLTCTTREIFIKVFGQDHPDVAVSYKNLALVYQRQGNHLQTKEMVTKAYHIFLMVLGPDHPQTQGLKPFVDE